uniref:Phospholipase B-like n=1 Tax=Arcella intermedia TaxID=1963864 RepID=A0A6B2L267_9EUKA
MQYLLLFAVVALVRSASPPLIKPTVVVPQDFKLLRTSGKSALYEVEIAGAPYQTAPYLLDLRGSRRDVGYDAAALMHNESSTMFGLFMSSMWPSWEDQLLINTFIDYCWSSFLQPNTPPEFLAELQGMKDFYAQNNIQDAYTLDLVSSRFYTLANMPADTQNIIDMLEQELEGNWPEWLKTAVNDIIKLLERLVHGCDSYGVWGSRTLGGLLYTSRNLDWNRNTGIDQFKLITMFHIVDPNLGTLPTYATFGFASGLGALAGMSAAGITVSEMNLDNSQVTFSGPPFPLRLRYVLERSHDLHSAQVNWLNTNNTNSFNFLVGSATDLLPGGASFGAYAMETIMGYTSFYRDNSPVENSATFQCDPKCSWTNQTGRVKIGYPLQEAVWRSNHAFDPLIMETQEPLFNDTVFRYNLLHDIFEQLQGSNTKIDDLTAVAIVATLGTKGDNFLSCDAGNFKRGDNVMSIVYAPGERGSNKAGHAYVAWEIGGEKWIPAACNSYVLIDFDRWNQ